ncbi:MAG: phage Gp37/Gp68 family protein [Chloroflexi bacterium]|nr:phage Gp37/Gp68 family protein [Chloroflexota bacterium]
MSDNSAIEWTDATWNPVTGCSKVSEGCRNCYAEALSLRFGRSTKPWAAQFADENVVLHPDRLDYPLKWKDARRIFVNSMSDLFHENIDDGFVCRVFKVMGAASHHTYQVLTKRPARMQALIQRWSDAFHGKRLDSDQGENTWPPPHIWLGVSVEDQKTADERIPLLLNTPAAVRFLSCEPLLASIDLCQAAGAPTDHAHGFACRTFLRDLHWVIVGGESGPRFRPLDLDWARSLRDQCISADVPFFFKQVGGRTPKSGGRLLDGRTWDEQPRVQERQLQVAAFG